jgi:inner membrane protein
MRKDVHIVFGILLFSIIFVVFKLEWWFAVFSIFGAVFPDLDFQTVVRNYHRQLFHNIWVLIISTIFISYISELAGICFIVGFLSHLLADSLTPAGIQLFYPIEKKYRLAHCLGIKTGGFRETIFEIIILILIVLVVLFFL